jgi:hypothetical protein
MLINAVVKKKDEILSYVMGNASRSGIYRKNSSTVDFYTSLFAP